MRPSTNKRETSCGSSDEEWWSGHFSAPFDIDQQAIPRNFNGKTQWHYYPTHPFKAMQGSARSFKVNVRWPNVSRRYPLPMADIRIIEEAVGSDQCDDIKAFLIQRCHLTVAEANELSWDEIVTHCRTCLRGMDRQERESQPEWSKITNKITIADTLGFDSTYKLNAMVGAGIYELKNPGGKRQSWQVRIDKLSPHQQKKLR